MKQIIVVLVIILNLCGSTIYANEKATRILVSAKHPTFTIRLKSNPTTGYSWFLQNYNPKIITPINHIFKRPPTHLTGAPGKEEWTFKVKPNAFLTLPETTIKMVYERPWQGGGIAAVREYLIVFRK